MKTNVKIFKSKLGFQVLEDAINKWLDANHHLEIVDIKYNDNNYYASALVIFKSN